MDTVIRPGKSTNSKDKFPTLTKKECGDYFWYGKVALGNMTQYPIGILWTNKDELFVGVEGRGAYTFNKWSQWGYVKTKLGLEDSDAKNIADFINSQLESCGEIQGEYREDLF